MIYCGELETNLKVAPEAETGQEKAPRRRAAIAAVHIEASICNKAPRIWNQRGALMQRDTRGDVKQGGPGGNQDNYANTNRNSHAYQTQGTMRRNVKGRYVAP